MGNKQKAVTVKDIANKMNISLSTVNKALTGKKGISEKRRKEILTLAKKMGYTVNYAAQAMSRNPLSIGVIMPKNLMWFNYFNYMHMGMVRELEHLKNNKVNGFVELVDYKGQLSQVEDAVKKFKEDGVDAIIYCPALYHSEEIGKIFKESGMPVFLAGASNKDIESVCTITIDGKQSGLAAAEFMSLVVPEGKIAVFTGYKNFEAHKEKVESFAEKLSENKNLQLVEVVETSDKEDIAEECIKELIRKHPDIKGIYISTAVAEPICAYIKENGLSGKIKVLTTDVYPQLIKYVDDNTVAATIFQNQVMLGKMAVQSAYEYLTMSRSYCEEEWEMYSQMLIKPQLLMPSAIKENLDNSGEGYIKR